MRRHRSSRRVSSGTAQLDTGEIDGEKDGRRRGSTGKGSALSGGCVSFFFSGVGVNMMSTSSLGGPGSLDRD